MGPVELQQMHTAFCVRDRPTQEVVRGTCTCPVLMHGLISRAEHDPWFPSTRTGRDQQCRVITERGNVTLPRPDSVPREQFSLLGSLLLFPSSNHVADAPADQRVRTEVFITRRSLISFLSSNPPGTETVKLDD